MKTITFEIKGITPLLQHRFGEVLEADPGKGTRRIHIKGEDPRQAAESCAYRLPTGGLYHPGAAIGRLLREAGGAHKQKGSRKSLKYVVPAAIRVREDVIPLHNGNGAAATEFEVDARPVTIPATKGRIMRYRPRLDTWSCTFTLVVNENLIDEAIVIQLLTEGGQQIGIGDYRPEKGGPFGCFQVVRVNGEGDGEGKDVSAPLRKRKRSRA